MFEVKTSVQFTEQQIHNLLCSAFEGGSNYWYNIKEFIKPKDEDLFKNDMNELFRHLDYPLSPGGALIIIDLNDWDEDEDPGAEKTEQYRLDLDSLKKGLQTMADKFPDHFKDFVDENDDANTGDVFLQCCLFDDVIFG